ncbi:WD40 repeat domain-containing protein [Streptomyces sp. NBC_00102]|uniref:WD40 repeat domain-containing protein n=1 Tax=Streptomyces sp. NBC_00102 TaxID=2975652 RepID=UPI002257731A|nr:WD40 repeat domain-containing protein [Streptomyces sp. NBC_00102]MCX5397721.1 WD40 repeat domain-containing protein [Streptomyces sp. NBC_00102]
MRASLAVLGTAALLLLAGSGPASADGGADQTFTIKDPRITESSGLAASRIHPGVYWTHNDSEDGPYLYAVDSRTGETVATVTMTGVGEPRDVEAISLGPDGNLYVGDIGDNLDGSWDHVWIYRLPEPKVLGDVTVRATQFDVTYADGARNAEALMVHPKTGRVWIASKNEDGGGLYEGPAHLSAGGNNVFRRVAEVPWVTDGAFSPDGTRLVLRGYLGADAYTFDDGKLGDERGVGAPFMMQAESVTYTADGTALMFGSEGKGSQVRRLDVKGTNAAQSTPVPSASDGSSSAGGPAEAGGKASGGEKGEEGGGSGGSATGKGKALFGGLIAIIAVWLVLRTKSRRTGG